MRLRREEKKMTDSSSKYYLGVADVWDLGIVSWKEMKQMLSIEDDEEPKAFTTIPKKRESDWRYFSTFMKTPLEAAMASCLSKRVRPEYYDEKWIEDFKKNVYRDQETGSYIYVKMSPLGSCKPPKPEHLQKFFKGEEANVPKTREEGEDYSFRLFVQVYVIDVLSTTKEAIPEEELR